MVRPLGCAISLTGDSHHLHMLAFDGKIYQAPLDKGIKVGCLLG